MPKTSKSSASSGTRKKHARKAAGPPPDIPASSQKSKPSKKEVKKGLAPPPKKSYIAPSKPKPTTVQVDPLDSLGLAVALPAELVVVLRRLAKKDSVTKTRALEELGVWVNRTKERKDLGIPAGQSDVPVGVLVTALPVWLHRYPALSVHPSRRIRHLSAMLHTSLLKSPILRNSILSFLLETGSESQVSQVLGAWCLSAWDVDRGVAALGNRSWKDAVSIRLHDNNSTPESDHTHFILDDSMLAQSVLPFILNTAMDPSSTYSNLNPSHSATLEDSPSSSHVGFRQGASPPIVAPSTSGGRTILSTEALSTMPSRGEDNPESTEDRNARLRVGALGALKWIFDTYPPSAPLVSAFGSLLASSQFWSILHHAAHPPFLETGNRLESPYAATGVIEGFGAGQTIVRRAGWGIVQALVGGSVIEAAGVTWKDHIFGSNSSWVLPSAVLRSAFVEPDPVVRSSMWGPLLVFLMKVEHVWMLNFGFEHTKGKSPNLDDSGSESSGSEDEMVSSTPRGDSTVDLASPSSSTAYAEFLSFLTLGCNGSPIQGYPTVLVVLSTIPMEILPPNLSALSEFFDALWAAIDGQVLSTLATERVKGIDAFLGAWGECLLWISGKLIKDGNVSSKSDPAILDDVGSSRDDVGQNSSISIAHALVNTQFGRLAEELGKGLRADADVVGGRVAAVIGKLELVAPDLFEQAWIQISRFATAAITNKENPSRGEYVLSFLTFLHQRLPHEGSSKHEVERLVIAIAMEVVTRCLTKYLRHGEDVGQDNFLTMVLERLLNIFGSVLDKDEQFIKNIDELLRTNLIHFVSQPSLILSYLTHRSDSARTTAIWRLLLSTLGSSADVELDTRLRVLDVLLDFAQQSSLASWAKPQEGELDDLAEHISSKALDGDATMLRLTERLLKVSDAFLDAAVTERVVSTILTTVRTHVQPLFRDPSAPLKTLSSSLKLLLTLERERTALLRASSTLMDVMPWIFPLAFVLPQCSPGEGELFVVDISKRIWEAWTESTDEEAHKIISEKIKDALKAFVLDTEVRPRPTFLLHALPNANLKTGRLTFSDILPTQSGLDSLLSSTSADPIDSSLAIIEPLAPSSYSARASGKSLWNRSFDGSGFSPYARSVSCLLHVMTSDRQVAREHMWALRHALILALFATEVLQVPGANSPVFGSNPRAAETELKEISRQTQQIAAFLLIPPGEETWHKEVVNVLVGNSSHSRRLDNMGNFVQLVFEMSMVHQTVRDSLVLHTVLQHVLRSATKDDADLWIELARGLGDKNLQTSLAISLAVTEFAPGPPKLDRYRNELASSVTRVSPTKANTIGLGLLRRLSAVAPNPDSDVIFMPQQRAVYLVQALQAWMASDEDLDESVESEVTLMLYHLAPILQNVQGAHWEFVMDMLESNIENSSFKDGDTLVLMSRSLHLLTNIQELSASNKYLREMWAERSKTILVMVRDLMAVKIDRTLPSTPRAMCREQALSIIQDLPDSLMDETTLSTMCHLVTDSSVDVQKMAHQLLQKAAMKRTEHLIVEAGVDSDTAVVELPPELIALLQNSINFEGDVIETGAGGQDPLAYLLGWMLLFDLFTNASLKVKTAYVDHMRNLNIIENYFLPNIFEILGIGGEGQKPFKLDAWSVEEYWVTLYDSAAPQSLRLLAAHLYYRALLIVPSLIRTWWDELKDRQLLTAVTMYTSSHFSPVLIKSELIHVKPSSSTPVDGEDSLTDESFNVKVALAIHEVIATFNVDDQQMEVAVRLPAEYPLRAVEVRDIRRVGVPEKLWRKWLFAMQQVVTSQNGRILDALSLFKKNVSLHFEGQVECAICYSIISVVDRSLPTKPCKTCKNRFHSSCLYKWFNTSHSSSCPLCRSDIM